ncbi:hypothetical protein BGW39_009312 [Mortierella sp. 14UC]|nr:hypothetical protein BGW39_009312 [Mortierella sp. 14UC]
MSQQNAVGSMDPFAHSSSNQPSTAAPSRVVSVSENPHGSIHHAASSSVGGEVYQQSQSQAPLNPSSIPSTTTITTTTTSTTDSAIPGRKPSLTGKLIAGATIAASTASNAATSAVAAARRLVGNGSTQVDLDDETTNTLPVEEMSSSKGGLLKFMKPSTTNNGLEFSQRRLSADKNKAHSSRHPVNHPVSPAAPAPVPAPAVVAATVPISMPSNAPSSAPTTIPATTHTTEHTSTTNPMQPMSNTMHSMSNTVHPTLQNTVHPSIPALAPAPIPAQSYAPAPTGIAFSGKQPIPFGSTNNNNNNNNNNNTTNTTTNTTAAGTTNPIPRKGSIVGQTALISEPHNTLYVTRQGGARSQALGVDQPSVSSTTANVKAQRLTGLGVDKPVYVNVYGNPKIHPRRRSSLHVDKTPVFSDEDQNSYTGNLLEANSNAVNPKNVAASAAAAPLNNSFPLRRRSSLSALNVDQPTVATSNVAGSGSTDNTNRDRPKGTYNSGYNVDRPGHHVQKKSGFGVDQPAIVTHQMAAVNGPKAQQQLPNNANTTTTITIENSRSDSPTFKKLHNPDNSTVHPYATTTTVSETLIDPAEMGPTIAYQQPPSSNDPSSAPVDPLVVPANYNGPIPQVAPGEQVIWVKKTTVQTEYYDGAHDNAGDSMPPEPVQNTGNQNRRGSIGSFLDRIRGRRASAVSMDKGKQRV